jgi:hypothetical protein
MLSVVGRTAICQYNYHLPHVGPDVSNTAIVVVRLVGRHSHVIKVLTPIAGEVWRVESFPGHSAGKSQVPHLTSLLDNTQAVDMFYTNTVWT